MTKDLKNLMNKWPKSKIKEIFEKNNNRYPDNFKKDVLSYINDFTQAEVGNVVNLSPGLISNWNLKNKKKSYKKTKKKKQEIKIDKELYIKDLKDEKRELKDLKNNIKKVGERIDKITLVKYLENIGEELIFDQKRDLGYRMLIVAHMIELLEQYLKNPTDKNYKMLEKKLL